MEYLSRLLSVLKEDKKFKYHAKCSKLKSTHQCLEDDMFSRGDPTSVSKIHEKFQIFSSASALQSNLFKSAVHSGGVKDTDARAIQDILGYPRGNLPFTYL